MAKKAKAVGWWAVYSEQVDAGKSKADAAKVASAAVKGKAVPMEPKADESQPKGKPKKTSKPVTPIKPKPKGKG